MRKIKCLLCSQKFRRITNTHLFKSHNITIKDYRKQFPNAPIDAPGLADERVAHLRDKSYQEVYGKQKSKKLKKTRSDDAARDWNSNPKRTLCKKKSQDKLRKIAAEKKLNPPLIGRPRKLENFGNSICNNCGEEFEYRKSDSDGLFCTTGCYIEYSRRHSTNYRIKAFSYYPHCCDICKEGEKQGIRLIVHHKDENPLNNSVKNLQILCNPHHQMFHKEKAAKYRNKFSPPAIERGVRDILYGLKVDIRDDNFFDTPKRVARAYREILEGILPESEEELKNHLSKTFPSDSDQMITIKDVLCWSMCPHHLLPVKYNISIAYIPKGRVLGASKLPRLAILLAKRPVLQEQLSEDIAEFLRKHANPVGVAVYIVGEHLCMQMRGIKTQSQMITSSLKGIFLKGTTKGLAARSEFMSLIDR